MAHRIFEHRDYPGLILSTSFDAAAGDASVTEVQAAKAADDIRAILDANGFVSCVGTVIINDRFHGVSILADDFLPKSFGIGATYDGVPVLFDRIEGGVKTFLARWEAQRNGASGPSAPPQPPQP